MTGKCYTKVKEDKSSFITHLLTHYNNKFLLDHVPNILLPR